MITHPLQPTFIDRAAEKSLVAAKVTATKKHSDDNEKCRCNGLRLIAMAWETFSGSVPEMHIMIRKMPFVTLISTTDPKDRPSTRSISAFSSHSSETLVSS